MWASIASRDAFGPGASSLSTNRRHGRLTADVLHQANAVAQDRPVIVGGQKILPDRQRGARIGAGKADLAAAFRPPWDRTAGKAIETAF